MEKIKSVKHLKELATNTRLECFISLNGGIRSSKDIEYYPEDEFFDIYNHIDDSDQGLKEHELYTESNIGEAIDKGALWMY